MLIAILMLILSGCGDGAGSASTNTPVDVVSTEDYDAINNLVPEREEMKTKIFDEIYKLK